MTFAEYPKMLLRGADELIVEDAAAEQAALADGYEFKGSDATPNNEPAKPVEAPKPFVEYPKMLICGDEHRIVEDDHSEAMARRDGFSLPGEEPKERTFDASPAQEQVPAAAADERVAKLEADLASADELITKLDEAGARVSTERDDALKALDEAKAEIETLKAELAKGDQGGTTENTATIKAELDDLGIEYDGRIKDPAKLAKILADAKAATDPEA